MHRYARLKGYDTGFDISVLNDFADEESISGYARESMPWAICRGLVKGRGNRMLVPTGTATRAEAARSSLCTAKK